MLNKKDRNSLMTLEKYVIRFIMSVTFVLSYLSSLSAFNHPEIQWKSVSTRHFIIHFYDKTEPALYATWKIAEEAFEAFDSLYHFSNKERIHLALADYDDYSNGFASWTDRSIMVWVPDSRFDLRSNTTWLRNVITHELAHIMSLDKKKGLQLLDMSFALQYVSPNVNVSYMEPVACMTFFPMWFAEGTSQLRAEQMGSDCWDSRRNMVLRCAALENKMLSLDEMSHFTHDIIGSEMVYNQGYAFTKYLESRIGVSKVAQIWNDNRGRDLFGTNLERFIQKHYTISLDEMYKAWRDSLKAEYKRELPKEPSQHTAIWEKGTINRLPRISSNGRYWGWLTNHKDDFSRTDLVIAEYGEKEAIIRIQWTKIGWDFSTDGNTVYYIKSRKPNRNGSFLNDLFAYDIKGGKETRLTHSARIYDIAASPNGKDLVCVQFKENLFSLVLFSLSNKEFTTIMEGVAGEPFLTSSFFPRDENKLIVSRIIQGKAGLFKIDIGSGDLDTLVFTEAQEETPYCGQDGRIYFSADYDGIFNIYSINQEGTDLKRHTTVIGGAFYPVYDKSGKLMISEYTANGFRIAQCPSDGASYEAPNTTICQFTSLPTPKGKVKIKESIYEPKYLRARWEMLVSMICLDMDRALQDIITEGEARDSSWSLLLDFEAGIGMARSDAVGKKDMYMGGVIKVMAGWDGDDDDTNTIRNTGKRITDVPVNLSHARFTAGPGYLRRRQQKLLGRISPALRRDIMTATMAYAPANDTDETSQSPVSLPFLIPFFGIKNRMLKPTVGFDAMVVLFSVMLPAVIYVDPYIEWHVARDLYVGVSPSFIVLPFSIADAGFGMSVPVWLQWMYNRYYNEDIYYNRAGISSLNFFIGPEITPTYEIEDQCDSTGTVVGSDTTFETATSLSCGMEFMHGFPILSYASINLSTGNYITKYNIKISGPINKYNDSTDYTFLLTSRNRTAFIFPIVRNINRGRLYADNLYGTLFYQLDFSGTEEYFSAAKNDAFIDKKYSSEFVSVSHLLGAGIEFGSIKHYTFMRTLKAEAAWDFFQEKFNFELSWRF